MLGSGNVLVAGLLATLAMDLASHALALAGIYRAPVNVTVIGRWVGHMLNGTFRHRDITDASPIRHEASIGFLAHYGIGLALALLYSALLELLSLDNGPLVGAIYGLLTNALPWLWLFPACGFGVMGRRGNGLLLSSFGNHVVFGVVLSLALR